MASSRKRSSKRRTLKNRKQGSSKNRKRMNPEKLKRIKSLLLRLKKKGKQTQNKFIKKLKDRLNITSNLSVDMILNRVNHYI